MAKDGLRPLNPADGAVGPTVDICVCTFRRPALADTLHSLLAQDAQPLRLRIIVADNDVEPSAQNLVKDIASKAETPIRYVHAPSRNISLARNACLAAADADWVAFIDDDETAPPNWIADLHQAAIRNGFDVVFGPVDAIYPPETPDWIKEGDYHSNRAPRQYGKVRTGHTCNVIMRWKGARWTEERFLLSKGRTGGEDVEFFFRLSRQGVEMGICDEALLYERAAPQRLNFKWIVRRRFLAGQFHGAHSPPPKGRILHQMALLGGSGVKLIYSGLRVLAQNWSPSARRRWMIRAAFHAGVCAAVFNFKEGEQY